MTSIRRKQGFIHSLQGCDGTYEKSPSSAAAAACTIAIRCPLGIQNGSVSDSLGKWEILVSAHIRAGSSKQDVCLRGPPGQDNIAHHSSESILFIEVYAAQHLNNHHLFTYTSAAAGHFLQASRAS